MKLENQSIRYSASDLVNYLGCKHLTELDRQTALGHRKPPDWRNPALELIQQKGIEHENAYVEYLKSTGLTVIELDGHSTQATIDAIIKGADIITQARFSKDGWVGIADILRKVEGKSKLGDYFYEIEDTKLARETKAGTVLQLCLYAELLGDLQERVPEMMRVVKPGEGFSVDEYRFPEFEAYYRFVKSQFLDTMNSGPQETYPMPVAKCDTCKWWKECNSKWHTDDHLCIIAGIRSNQIKELNLQGISTLAGYAQEDKPFKSKPSQGNEETYKKIHDQAGIQLKGRNKGELLYDLLPINPLRGLNRLPEPSTGDIYFDIEGDHFYEDGGLEYLLGISFKNGKGDLAYKAFWAKNRKEEKKAFNDFMEFIMERWEKYPDMHIYHYAPYEPTAIKKLASRNAIFEEEVDQILRAERFVDLFSIIKETLIASVESYSLKDIEKLAGFTRKADLRLASDARRRMSIALDFNDFSGMVKDDFELIELYNQDDCVATKELHDWIEQIYQEQLKDGEALVRPEEKTGEASEHISEDEQKARQLYEALIDNLPDDPADWSKEDKAKWLLAHQVDFYRREMRSAYWEFFRLNDLEPDELLNERKGIFGLKFIEKLPESKQVFIHRYSFPAQEISLEKGKELQIQHEGKIGTIEDFSLEKMTIDIKKTKKTNEVHSASLFIKDIVSPGVLVPSLFQFAQSVIDEGINADGPYRAGRDLLLKNPPRMSGEMLFQVDENETLEQNALKIARSLDNGILPVQGPPGTGKTHLGGKLIAELANKGYNVGVTAVSHKVIRNLLDKAVERGNELGYTVTIKHKDKSGVKIEAGDNIRIKNKDEAKAALSRGEVVGGTAWLWADDIFEEALDYLFVDEAGQMSLTNVLTISRAAKNIILLGDPQQLEQPQKGAHPEGADISALEHILDGHKTMPLDKGLFLGTTWRLNPDITEFTSILYYEGRLKSKEGLDNQKISGDSTFSGSGLFYVPVQHEGNQSRSNEEVDKIRRIVKHLLNSGLTWTDREGNNKPLKHEDILIIAPYNAQVSALQQALPELSIGTVDKFQGQEGPVVIYSMASSSPEDAPRGMSFLYSPNRLNVATSRAKCISILVASPKLFEAECNTIEQMKWANGLCLYAEMSNLVEF